MPNIDEKKLEIQTKITALIQMMGLDAPDAKNNMLYEDFVGSMNNLMEKINELYTPDEETGKCRAITNDDKTDFDLLIGVAINKANGILYADDSTRAAEYRKEICSSIKSLLEKDRATIGSLDTSYGLPLPEVLKEARTDVVDISGQQLSTVGGSISTRIPISYTDAKGKEKRGFFTKASHVQSEEELKEKLAEKIEAYPKYSNILNEYLKAAELRDMVEDLSQPGKFTPKWIQKELGNYVDADEMNLSELSNDKDFQKAFYDFYTTGFSLATRASTDVTLGLNQGENIDGRSTALSVVAELLGKEKLIAKSVNMKIKVGDEVFEGTFIEEAQGKDLGNINDPDDTMLSLTDEKLNNPDVNKQLCDLAVLDFVCGNIDRHSGNIIYQFDKNGKISGIVGIDNDSSFSNIKEIDPAMSQGMNANPFDRNYAVSEEMAAKILNLEDDVLRYALAGTKLKSESIDRAVERLHFVQDRINKDLKYFKGKDPTALEHGHLHVIKDNDWNLISTKDLAFCEIPGMPERRNLPKSELKSADLTAGPVSFVYFLDRYAKANYEEKQNQPELGKKAPISFAKGKLAAQEINIVGRSSQLNSKLSVHKKDLENCTKVFNFLEQDIRIPKSSSYNKFKKAFSNAYEKFVTRTHPNHTSRKIPKGPLSRKEISDFADSFKAVKDLGDFCVDDLLKKAELTPAEKTMLTAAKGLTRALEQKSTEFKAATGVSQITNRGAARVLMKKSDILARKALTARKPDQDQLRLALATKKYARELAEKPNGTVYNSELAQKKIEEYSASKEITEVSKNIDANRAIAAQRLSEFQYSKEFFFKSFVGRNGDFKKPLQSKFGLSVSRHAMCTLAVAFMLREGHRLEDIFNPDKLQAEREQAGKDIMDLYMNADDKTLLNVSSDLIAEGLETAMKQTGEALNRLPSIDGKTLCTPENAYLISSSKFIQDLGQELGRSEIKKTAEELYSKEYVADLISKQHGSCLALSGIYQGHFAKANLAAGELEAIKGYDPKRFASGDTTELMDEIQSVVLSNIVINAAQEKLVSEEMKKPGFDFFNNFRVENDAGTVAGTNKASAMSQVDHIQQMYSFISGDIKANAMTLGSELLKGNIVSKDSIIDMNEYGIQLSDIKENIDALPHKDGPEAEKNEKVVKSEKPKANRVMM